MYLMGRAGKVWAHAKPARVLAVAAVKTVRLFMAIKTPWLNGVKVGNYTPEFDLSSRLTPTPHRDLPRWRQINGLSVPCWLAGQSLSPA
jgi:ectoine hydroxylase-related dioxygenase (phytanoyl-CoA dioxygenase family)